MNITIEQQRTYIDEVVARVINGNLDRLAGVYRIDTMIELVPTLYSYGHKAIAKIYENVELPSTV